MPIHDIYIIPEEDLMGMQRILVDMPEDAVELIERAAKQQGISRAEWIRRRAIEGLKAEDGTAFEKAFGAWKDVFPEDGLAYQERLRADWKD
jgi:hypothetical protein